MEAFFRASRCRILRPAFNPGPRRPWVCHSCRNDASWRSRRGLTTTTTDTSTTDASSTATSAPAQPQADNPKPFYITTPIFYVNASPHVGHMYSMVLADAIKRWEGLDPKRRVILSTGTDEHGLKVQQTAERQGLSPMALCDANSKTFLGLAKNSNLDMSPGSFHFVRTTDGDHRQAVEYFWQRLQERGYIYETRHEGWYAVSDEAFYPESAIEKRTSKLTGKAYMASTETGSIVEWTEEKNYHFRLKAMRQRLLDLYEQNPDWIAPVSRQREVVRWVEENLEDLSISRPASRLQWGIPVPGDPSQTIYVWVDALVNYITKAGYPNWAPGQEHAEGWPADVHVVGKDIIRFHCIYWPALLMALDLPLPGRVLSHAHWLMDNAKMSKSRGNVVNPFFANDRFGADTIRFFMLSSCGIIKDTDYNNELVVQIYKSLQGNLGNLLGRVTRSKHFSARVAVQNFAGNPDFEESSLVQGTLTVVDKAREAMKELRPDLAIKAIMDQIFETNRFITEMEPWTLARQGKSESLHKTVFAAAESLRIIGILLQPFIPQKAAELLDRMGVDPGCRTIHHAVPHADRSYGESRVEISTGPYGSLFPPLAVVD